MGAVVTSPWRDGSHPLHPVLLFIPSDPAVPNMVRTSYFKGPSTTSMPQLPRPIAARDPDHAHPPRSLIHHTRIMATKGTVVTVTVRGVDCGLASRGARGSLPAAPVNRGCAIAIVALACERTRQRTQHGTTSWPGTPRAPCHTLVGHDGDENGTTTVKVSNSNGVHVCPSKLRMTITTP